MADQDKFDYIESDFSLKTRILPDFTGFYRVQKLKLCLKMGIFNQKWTHKQYNNRLNDKMPKLTKY